MCYVSYQLFVSLRTDELRLIYIRIWRLNFHCQQYLLFSCELLGKFRRVVSFYNLLARYAVSATQVVDTVYLHSGLQTSRGKSCL